MSYSVDASLNGTFHLSPHENICTTALKNIHCLYTCTVFLKNELNFVVKGIIIIMSFSLLGNSFFYIIYVFTFYKKLSLFDNNSVIRWGDWAAEATLIAIT